MFINRDIPSNSSLRNATRDEIDVFTLSKERTETIVQFAVIGIMGIIAYAVIWRCCTWITQPRVASPVPESLHTVSDIPAINTRSATRIALRLARHVEIEQEVPSGSLLQWNSNHPEKFGSLSQIICAICLDSISDAQIIRYMSCTHIFHTECLDEWYARGHNECPQCRGQICTPDPAHLKGLKANDEFG